MNLTNVAAAQRQPTLDLCPPLPCECNGRDYHYDAKIVTVSVVKLAHCGQGDPRLARSGCSFDDASTAGQRPSRQRFLLPKPKG